MRNVKLTALIGKSFDRMIEILFKPFSVNKWLKLILIAFLAGALAGGNGSGGGGGNNHPPQKQEVKQAAGQTGTGQASEKTPGQVHAVSGAISQPAAPAKAPSAPPPLIVIALIVGAVLICILALLLLMTWLGSRFRFVWFNAIVNNTGSIIEPYSRHSRGANSLFKFSILVFVGFLIFTALDVGGALYAMYKVGAFGHGFVWSVPVALKIFLLPTLFFLVAILALVILNVIIDNFAVPIMALDELRLVPALEKFGDIFLRNWRDVILFLLVLLLLGIVASAAVGVIALLMLLVILLIAAVVFGLPFLIIAMAMKAKLIFIIYAIVVGIPFIIATIITLIATALPVAVFFRLFSLYYLMSLDSGYTQESLDRYAARKARVVSKTAPVVLIIGLFAIGFVFLVGLLAAIAIPNFVRAKQAAIEKQNASVIHTTVSSTSK